MAKGLSPMAVWGLARELKFASQETRPLLVSGALSEQLAKELSGGAEPGAVRVGGRVEDAACLIRILAGAPSEEDEQELRAAKRAKVPVVAVQTGTEDFEIPYVLATDVVKCRPGEGFPIDEIVAAVAARLGEAGTGLTARVPVLREPLCRVMIESFARRNGILGVAVFVPGADFPVLTLNQIRLVLAACRRARRRDRPEAGSGGACHRRGGIRLPRLCAPAARRDPGRRLGGQGRRRLRRHASARRGRLALLSGAGHGIRGSGSRDAQRSLKAAASRPRGRTLRRRSAVLRPVQVLWFRKRREGGEMVGSEHAEELLQIEEADAWFEYLEATRAQNETRYAELEPWAWARLSQRLRAVRARRARLRPAAA